ncbi:MAG: hypothetical protein RL328_2105, partial [Acidobacteriota bacterium]
MRFVISSEIAPMHDSQRPTRARHVVLWMTVAVYMITYMDRVVLSSAQTDMRTELGFDLTTMSYIIGGFSWSYALFQIPGGLLGDKIGPRRALSLIVVWWSAFTSLTAMVTGATTLWFTRFLFGIGEAGAFPIATRSFSRWIVATERGYAQGVTHAGARLGLAVTPVAVAWMIGRVGWRTPFFISGAIGLLWAALWFFYYRDSPDDHSGVNEAELDLIHKGGAIKKAAVGKVPWGLILKSRTMWFLCAMYFCYNYTLNLYVNWIPTYLREGRGLDRQDAGSYASLVLLAGVPGALLGGMFSDRLLHRTGNVNLSRRWVAIAGFVLYVLVTIPAALSTNVYVTIGLLCVAFFAVEWTVGISWAIPLDIGGDYSGTLSAAMNMCGNLGGALATTYFGKLVENYGWSVPFQITTGLAALAALFYLRIDAT